MPYRRTTFSKFVIEDLRRQGSAHDPELAALLNEMQRAGKLIGAAVSRGALDAAGALVTTSVQVPGTPPEQLDQTANQILIGATEWGGQLCGIVSGAMAEPYAIPKEYPRGRYLLLVDPMEGAANLDVGMPVGTFFSVLRAPDGVTNALPEHFLQPGRRQVAAGYILFGPTGMIVVTTGAGVHGFTLDREAGAYTMTHPNLRIATERCDLAIDASNEPFWEDPIRRYVAECTQGTSGPRGSTYTMGWVGSVVAALHRILLRGGVCLIPRDTRAHGKGGHTRLLYQANPLAMLVEQAGGTASTGRGPVLDVIPEEIHQQTPLIFGCTRDVEMIERYHAMHDSGEALIFDAPLFKKRTIFRTA